MQTFLPYQNFYLSLACLDNKRLGKQRVEAMQILNALTPGSTSRWRNHPATKMWKGHEPALENYKNLAILTWKFRGFKNTMPLTFDFCRSDNLKKPLWLTEEFCSAHRSNLLRKKPEFYSKYGWTEPNNLPYIWPKGNDYAN